MKIFPFLVAFGFVSLSACDKIGESLQSSPSAPSVPSKPTKDPVAELKALLDKAAKAPMPADPSGWLKVTKWEITKMDVSKTNSLTAPYSGTLDVRSTQTDDPTMVMNYRVSLEYGENGWLWDGNMLLWNKGNLASREYVAESIERKIFILHFRFPTR